MDRLSASACLMIVSDLDHTMVDHHDVENVYLLCCYIYHAQDPSAVTVHLSGAEKTLHECLHELKGWVWRQARKKFLRLGGMDRVLSTQIGSSAWLVNFNKWEQRGKRGAVVQPPERSLLRRAMIHMASPRCIYNRRGRKDREGKTIQPGCSRLISDTIPDLSSSRVFDQYSIKVTVLMILIFHLSYIELYTITGYQRSFPS